MYSLVFAYSICPPVFFLFCLCAYFLFLLSYMLFSTSNMCDISMFLLRHHISQTSSLFSPALQSSRLIFFSENINLFEKRHVKNDALFYLALLMPSPFVDVRSDLFGSYVLELSKSCTKPNGTQKQMTLPALSPKRSDYDFEL